MSLDVYLTEPGARRVRGGSGIFVRETGRTREISREEWDRLHPGQEPVILRRDGSDEDSVVYEANITHNLGAMAHAAGIYAALWRPEELIERETIYARDLIGPLTEGLSVLRSDPARFEELNPENGWGDYRGLVSFVERYLSACIEHPDAVVGVSR